MGSLRIFTVNLYHRRTPLKLKVIADSTSKAFAMYVSDTKYLRGFHYTDESAAAGFDRCTFLSRKQPLRLAVRCGVDVVVMLSSPPVRRVKCRKDVSFSHK